MYESACVDKVCQATRGKNGGIDLRINLKNKT